MTGDRVNVAPALKAAHIGVAMGARGTDVAREAAALVLLNDDFSSLVVAVCYGRRVFANLRKAIVFVIAVHVPIIGFSVLPVLFGWPLILLPVHILFLQFIVDPACSVVFEAKPLEAHAMQEKPRNPAPHLFDAMVLARGFWQGLGLLVILLVAYAMARDATGSDDSARAMVFVVLVLSNLGLIQASRLWAPTPLRASRLVNPYFGWISLFTVLLLACALMIPTVSRLFGFELPAPAMLLTGLGFGVLGLAWFESVKWVFLRRSKRVPGEPIAI